MFEKVISSSSIEEIPIYSEEMNSLEKFLTCLYTSFLLKNGYLLNEEKVIYNNLTRILSDTSENNVRFQLAVEACAGENFPEELAIKLAYDQYEIAEQVILNYTKFSDELMLRMVEDFHDEKRILLIARRPNIGFAVTDKLIGVAKANVTKAVLENDTAKISIKALQIILARHQHNKEFLDVIYHRKDVNKSKVIELLDIVDSPIKQNMIDNYWGGEVAILPFSKLNILNLTEAQIKKNYEYRNLTSNINNIYKLNQLNWHVLLSYLIKGDLFSFIYGISQLVNMPFAKVKDVVLNYTETLEFLTLIKSLKIQPDYCLPLQILLSEIAKGLKKGELTPENYSSKVNEIIENKKLERLGYLKKLV